MSFVDLKLIFFRIVKIKRISMSISLISFKNSLSLMCLCVKWGSASEEIFRRKRKGFQYILDLMDKEFVRFGVGPKVLAEISSLGFKFQKPRSVFLSDIFCGQIIFST